MAQKTILYISDTLDKVAAGAARSLKRYIDQYFESDDIKAINDITELKTKIAGTNSLVVITNLHYFNNDIENSVYGLLKSIQKAVGDTFDSKEFHLICLMAEKEKDVDDLINTKDNPFLTDDIKHSSLMLKYMASAKSITMFNFLSDDFLERLTNRITHLRGGPNPNKETNSYCSLKGFYRLAKVYIEVAKKMMGSEFERTQNWENDDYKKMDGQKSPIRELIDRYKYSLEGHPEKGGHGARRRLDQHFSTKQYNEHPKNREATGDSAREERFILYTRDFARNIADNVWHRNSKHEINVLIIDDRPDLFEDELSYIKKCFPSFSYHIKKNYKKFLNIEASDDLLKYLSNYNFILIDLLFDRKNIGFKIIRELNRLKQKNQNFRADIFILSRSTNTNDIQRALNEGACGYIFKNRIFSMPYRLCEVLPQKEEEEHDDLLDYIEPFSSLKRFPLKVIKKLKSSPFFDDDKGENRKWIEALPKADLHCHLGGAMNAEITLKLALNIVRDTVFAYKETGSFVISVPLLKDDLRGKHRNNEDNKREEFLKLNRLVTRVACEINRHVRSDTGNVFDSSLENHFKWIAENIKAIKLYQVISFFLVQLSILDNTRLKISESDMDFRSIDELCEYIVEICNHNTKIEPLLRNDSIIKRLLQATGGKPIEECGRMGLLQFLMGAFYTGSAVLQTRENLEEAAEHICNKAEEHNIKYLELRCTPANFTRGNLSEEEVIEILKNKFDNFNPKQNKTNPVVQLVIVGKRHGKEEELKKNISLAVREAMKQQASENVEEEAEEIKTSVCGFDLAGEEAFYDPRLFRENFRGLFDSCIPLTIHAGEETDVSRIWQAVYELHADRIGHGLSLGKESESAKGLISRFRDQKICIELCPSSNFLTKGFRLPITPYTLKSQPPWNHLQDKIKEIIVKNINEFNKMKTENETKKEIEQWEELKGKIQKIQDEKHGDNKIAYKGVMDDQERQKLLSLMQGGCDREEYEKAISSLFKRSNMDAYPLKYFLQQKLQVTINTDDPAICGSNLSNEYLFASELFHASFAKEKNEDKEEDKKARRHLTKWEVLKLLKMGFKHAFLDADSRRKLIREVDELIYDKILEDEKME